MSIGLLISAAGPAMADVHPNTAGGFPVDQSFHVGDIDSVNLFNGSLTLTLPIGPSFPVNGGFSYGLKLVYNSNPWIFQSVDRPDLNGTRIQADPTPCSNAGLGWRLSLGRMDPPCQVPDSNGVPPNPIYQDEMGTDHIFYPTLHAGDPEDAPVFDVQDIRYTRDGSYLRLKIHNSGFREVEFPDGTVRTFDTTGMPTQIRDAFQNALNIGYAFAGDHVTIIQWTLSDTQNRTQKVFLHTDATSHLQLIDSIQVTAFGGTSATYFFNYNYPSIWRACPHSNSGPNGASDAVTVPALTSVILPDGSAFTTTANDYLNLPQAPGQHCSTGSGNLTALNLPTLGRMEWTWQTFQFPTGSTSKPHLQANPGVATRTMKGATGTILGTWTYAQTSDQPLVTTPETKTTVTDP
ncbi:MAG TPA: hypothetical protein VLV54_03165, partial [Thermoanaerobaculia bacterium]|nr:hypothetical protein [Thermoanaerobaculia bacterium]